MPIDANIAMGVKPIELESPLNSLAKMLQVQDMQQSGQLNRMKMDEYGRGVERTNKLQSILSGEYANPEARQSAMLKGGFLKEATDYAKGNSDLAKTNMEVSKGEADILDKTLSSFRSYVPQINSPEAAGQYTAAMYDHPVLGKYAAQFGTREDVIRRNVEKFQQDPRAWAVGSAGISADKLLESLKGTRQNTNMGGTYQGQTTNYYGEVVPGSTTNTPITQSADSKASERSAAAGRAVTMRGQDLTNARAKETTQSGKAPPGYRWGADGRSLESIPGGPADLKNSATATQKVNEAKDVLSLLDEVDALLPKATGSYLGAGIDSVAGAVGYGTKGAESGAQLKALEGALISKMPKMSGPQSDKDVLLYKQMAGQIGDATIPVSTRKAASKLIRKLNEKYAGASSSDPLDSLLDKYK